MKSIFIFYVDEIILIFFFLLEKNFFECRYIYIVFCFVTTHNNTTHASTPSCIIAHTNMHRCLTVTLTLTQHTCAPSSPAAHRQHSLSI